MKGKKDQPKEKLTVKKIGRPLKEIIPQSSKLPRENIPIKQPEITPKDFAPETQPNDLFPDWPTDDEINVK